MEGQTAGTNGDSFHVITGDGGREIVARLYFVDAPEAETAYRDRLDEQAAYFGLTREQAVQIAHEAAAFTRKRLAAPFTVWTRWRSALGRSALRRVYCIIIDSTGEDLNEALVRAYICCWGFIPVCTADGFLRPGQAIEIAVAQQREKFVTEGPASRGAARWP